MRKVKIFIQIVILLLSVCLINTNNDFNEVNAITLDNISNTVISYLKDFIKINDFEYHGAITYEDLYKYMSNNLFIYTLDIQRDATFKKMGKGYIKTATIDSKAVKNIEETALRGELETTQIVLTLLIDEGSVPKISFKSKYNNIGDVAKNIAKIKYLE